MDYLTVKEASAKQVALNQMVFYSHLTGVISGSIKKGNLWPIPTAVVKLIDKKVKIHDNQISKVSGDLS